MFGKKVKSRILFICLLLFSLILATYIIFKALEENVVYFKSPSEVKNISELEIKKKIVSECSNLGSEGQKNALLGLVK